MFTEDEINGFVENYFSGAKPAVLNSFLDTVINRFNRYLPEEKEQFRQKMQDFTRRYAFVSQIITFEDTALEKLYIFGKMLIRKLSVIRERLPFEILESVDIESYKLTKTQQSPISLGNQPGELYPMQSGGHGIAHEELDPLSRIIKDINERFGTDFSAEDRVITQNLSRRLINNVDLQGSIKNNNRDAAKLKFNDLFQTELVNLLNSHFNYYQKLDKNPELKDEVRDKLFDYVHNKVRINS